MFGPTFTSEYALIAYIDTVRKVADDWARFDTPDDEYDLMETGKMHKIQASILTLLMGAVDIYLPVDAATKEVVELFRLCWYRMKHEPGSSVPADKVLDTWISECNIKLPMPLSRAEKKLYSNIAAVSISLTCTVQKENGVWVIRNAKWCD